MSPKFKNYEEFAQFVGTEPRCVLAAGGGCETTEDALLALVPANEDIEVRSARATAQLAATSAQNERRPLAR